MNTRVDRKTSTLLARLLGTSLLHPLNDPSMWREMLSSVNPMWALGQVRARVLKVRDESPDVRSFVLQPNRAWCGYRAGQHVLVELEINGVRRQRTFSISSAPEQGRGSRARRAPLVLSIKRHAAGGVTDWIHRHVVAGSVLRLSQAMGEFAAPALEQAAGLLLLSAGSGITPVFSVLCDLLRGGCDTPITFLHVCRNPSDALFDDHLQSLAQAHPNLRVLRWISSTRGRLDAAALLQQVHNATDLPTLLCGPTALMQDISALYRSKDALGRLFFEDFNGAMRQAPRGDGRSHAVRGPGPAQSFTVPAGASLLQAAEAAGLRPAYGCRIGICMTCQCTKRSGVVENLRTGAISTQADERIQLCVSIARSDLELAP